MEAGLERLQKQGIIEPVQFSDWAAPTVPILKNDESVRICGDCKITINQVDRYPIPTVDDLFASLAGEKTFISLVHINKFSWIKNLISMS